MKINIKQVLAILLLSFFFATIRYFLLNEEYTLIKRSKLESIDNNINYQRIDSLVLFIENTTSPKLIDINLTKMLFDNSLATFVDARDSESYKEGHILKAINIPYELVEDIVNEYDLRYLIDLNEDFIEKINIDANNPFYFGLRDGIIYLSSNKELSNDQLTNKESSFVIYCSGEGCSLSEDLGFYIHNELGIQKIFIYEGGMPEWINNNYPVE